ncbi:hypothetical protein J2W40_000615 [Sphingobium xenophagum]|uniref:DUF4198 domain-containing protein n=1 Tax=Sphingobium xenophagum TaxID=121428 RepID=A0ABU1WWX8_SPHXE|nr:hypothetical protein [Sphingobium xenophagum]MDR7153818.1 hypothetical protein [Sphingobium xenophagum]
MRGYGLAAALFCLFALAGAAHFRLLPLPDGIFASDSVVKASARTGRMEGWRYLPVLR